MRFDLTKPAEISDVTALRVAAGRPARMTPKDARTPRKREKVIGYVEVGN
jgi:hypothetical protein